MSEFLLILLGVFLGVGITFFGIFAGHVMKDDRPDFDLEERRRAWMNNGNDDY